MAIQTLKSPDQIDAIARMLTRAFACDPLLLYMNRQAPTAESLMMTWMGPIVRYGFHRGEVLVASDSAGKTLGTCLCLGPDEPFVSTFAMLKYGMYRLPLDWPIGNCLRAAWSTRQFSGQQKKFAPARHYYLLTLGVEPELKGQGLGRKLVEELMVKARAAGVPIYLETTREENLAFYAKLGFEVCAEVMASAGPPVLKVWSLRWNP